MFYVPESPRWLFQKRRYKEARDALVYLADQNGFDKQPLVDNRFTEEIIENEENIQPRMSIGSEQNDEIE